MQSLTFPKPKPNSKGYPHKSYGMGIKIKPEEVFIKLDDIKIPKELIREKLNTCTCSVPGKDISGTDKCGYCHKALANPLDVNMDIDARTTNHVKDKKED